MRSAMVAASLPVLVGEGGRRVALAGCRALVATPQIVYSIPIMDWEAIEFETDPDHVATITLNRPAALNSFNDRMAQEVASAWETVRDTDDIHAVVLRAAGDRAFSTGVDIKGD